MISAFCMFPKLQQNMPINLLAILKMKHNHITIFYALCNFGICTMFTKALHALN